MIPQHVALYSVTLRKLETATQGFLKGVAVLRFRVSPLETPFRDGLTPISEVTA